MQPSSDPQSEVVERQYRPGGVLTPEQSDEFAQANDLSAGMPAAVEPEGGWNDSPTFDTSDPRPWAPGEPAGTQLIEREIIERGASADVEPGAEQDLVVDPSEGESSTPGDE